MKNLPIFFVFYLFPMVSLFARLIGLGQLNYDYFWIVAFIFISCQIFQIRIQTKHKVFLSVLSLLFFLKYVIPYFIVPNVQLQPLLMDAKWIVYLLFAILWINKYGYTDERYIYNGSLFFSKVYIVYALISFSRQEIGREGLIMEANYDGFMILMGFCFVDNYRKGWRDVAIFTVATFLTLSRTGFACMLIILFYKTIKKNLLYFIPVIPIVAVILNYAISLRGEDSVNHLDRFIFFNQTILYLEHTGLKNILFGNTPGLSLEMPILPEFEWNIELFEEKRNLIGIYPFYFHSAYLRLIFTWGVPAAILFLLYFVYKHFTSNYLPMKYMCILALVQSISLSTLTLQNVSVLFFMMMLVLLNKEKHYDSKENSLLLVKRRPISRENTKVYQ